VSASVVTVGFGSMPLLGACVDGLLQADGVDEVVLVDNGLDAASMATLPVAPDGRLRVYVPGTNLGFAGGCNAGAARAAGDVVAFVNPDLLVEPCAIAAIEAAARDEDVAIATGEVRLDDGRRLNATGGVLHFTGLGWSEHFGDPIGDAGPSRHVMIASGALMAVRRSVWDELGGFTDDLFLYHEDAELSLRAWLRGYDNAFVAGAVGLHHYEFSRNARKLYFLERNRLYLVAVCFPARLLAVVLPALLVYELGIVAVATKEGWLREKVDGWRWLVAHRRVLLERRRAVRSSRRRSSSELAARLAASFDAGNYPLSPVLRAADRVLAAYWRLVRGLA
jgi:GT2 family glycosyltransferase